MIKVVGANFKPSGHVYYFLAQDMDFEIGDAIIVQTEKGLQYAKVVYPCCYLDEKDTALTFKPVIRLATKADEKQYKKNQQDSKNALADARKFANKLKLDMHLLEASFTFDRKQLIFQFTAEDRVDFRELARNLAKIYHTRIELRQIGVRDKAKEIGGLGPCGRFLCCSSFLTEFNSVSINMAKNQFISLNPSKINGVCGRLLCCLNYEDALYSELKKDLPAIGTLIPTPEGMGKVISLQVFEKKVTVEFKDKHTSVYGMEDLPDGSHS